MTVTLPDLETARFLISQPGRVLLTQAEVLRMEGRDTLAALSRLRRDATIAQSSAAWEQTTLRQRAISKFGTDAARMLFTREALEQASGRRTAQYHAQRFTGTSHVSDLCGGIGADALAFVRMGLSVTLYELDPVRALFAGHNADTLGFSSLCSVVSGDVTTIDLAPGAAWFDPARRAEGRRVGATEDYAPPLSWARDLTAWNVSPLGIKVSPAVPHSIAEEMGMSLEFVSDAGECKEGLLWSASPGIAMPQGSAVGAVTATLLSDAGPLHLTGTPDVRPLPPGDGSILYEPDPAVIRAHLVGTLAGQINAAPVDPQIAYLLGQEYISTPFASAYAVHDRFAWSRRRLQERLSAVHAGRIVIKKRGFPQEPDDVRRGLKLTGTEEWTVVLARVGTGHDVFLCHPIL